MNRQRPRSIHEMVAVLDQVIDDAAIERSLAFSPAPDDIIVAPYAKCGTTWLLQIMHGLRSGASMDFASIGDVAPWIELAETFAIDLHAPQPARPRLFKSHVPFDAVPQGCRYVCAFREPGAALLSFYRFYEGWLFEPGSIPLEPFASWRWPTEQLHRKGYWHHLASWWAQRHNPNVLLLCYEDMLARPRANVERIARFMGIEPDETLLETVLHRSSRAFMLQHRERFKEHRLIRLLSERAGLPAPIDASMVGAHSTRAQASLPPALRAWLDAVWAEHLPPHVGCKDYDALRAALGAVDARSIPSNRIQAPDDARRVRKYRFPTTAENSTAAMTKA